MRHAVLDQHPASSERLDTTDKISETHHCKEAYKVAGSEETPRARDGRSGGGTDGMPVPPIALAGRTVANVCGCSV